MEYIVVTRYYTDSFYETFTDYKKALMFAHNQSIKNNLNFVSIYEKKEDIKVEYTFSSVKSS